MNNSRHLDSCIQILKRMCGDESNELGSEEQRALAKEIRKLKRLKKGQQLSREEVFRVVSEVSEAVSKISR